jgi:predicted nucleic acid-binding Zn ribbon protein
LIVQIYFCSRICGCALGQTHQNTRHRILSFESYFALISVFLVLSLTLSLSLLKRRKAQKAMCSNTGLQKWNKNKQ